MKQFITVVRFVAIYVSGFHQYTITGICGMVPDRLFTMHFHRAQFPPTAIGQKDYKMGHSKDQAP